MSTATPASLRYRDYRLPTRLRITLYRNGERIAGQGENLSATGLRVRCPCRLEEGSAVEVELELDGEALLLAAEVARADAFGAGLRFVDLARDAELSIVYHVARGRALIEAAGIGARVTRAPTRSARRLPPRRSAPPAGGRGWARRVLRAGVAVLALILAPGAVALHWYASSKPALLPATSAVAPAPAAAGDAIAAAPAETRIRPGIGGAVEAPVLMAAAPAPARAEPERVADLLAAGRERMKAGQWSLPAGSSALDAWRGVLRADPGNAEARSGVSSIVSGYRERARECRTRNDRDGARWRLERALAIVEHDSAQAALADPETTARELRAELGRLERPAASRPQRTAQLRRAR